MVLRPRFELGTPAFSELVLKSLAFHPSLNLAHKPKMRPGYAGLVKERELLSEVALHGITQQTREFDDAPTGAGYD